MSQPGRLTPGGPNVDWASMCCRMVLPLLLLVAALPGFVRTHADVPPVPGAWPDHPLTLVQCMDLALVQSPAIARARKDIAESSGLAVQARSAARPRLGASGNFTQDDEDRIETVPLGPSGFRFRRDQNWSATIQVVQPLFAGGRIRSQLRSATLTEDAAMAAFHARVSEVLLQVRITFDDILLGAEQISVQEASIRLLEQELADTRRRYEAGAAPRFNVLRAEVELANARPRLIRARNAHRVGRNNLANLLGWNVPPGTGEEIPLRIDGSLAREPVTVDLAAAIARGLQQRPEIRAARTASRLRAEEVVQARAGLIPQLQGVAGYGWQNRAFGTSLSDEVHGWTAGVQLTWDIWDGSLTRGKVRAARARSERAAIEVDDAVRTVELEVRTAMSHVQEAQEVLDSQSRVIEQAAEAVRLAQARADAGSGTQLDVLSAQTALTEARTTYAVALRDFDVARARLDRAMGEGLRLP